MADSQYANMVYPAAASFVTTPADCCSSPSSIGAAGARSPDEHRTDQIADGFPAAAGAAAAPARRRGGCRCWWVALAAIVLIAVVAKS